MPRYNVRGGFGAATSLGLAGASIGGLPGGIIGALLGAVTGFADEGESVEDTRQARKGELIRKIAQSRVRALQQGTRYLKSQYAGAIGAAQAGAARRAAASGRVGDTESLLLPEQSRVAGEYSGATEKFMTGVEDWANKAELGVEEAFADRPIQPGVTDYVTALGESAVKFKQSLDQYELEKRLSEQGNITTPSETATNPSLLPSTGFGDTVKSPAIKYGESNLLDMYRRARRV